MSDTVEMIHEDALPGHESDLDFPTLSAECRQVVRGSASNDQPRVIPAGAARS